MDFKKNERYILNITDIGVNGEGIGKLDGYTFFVDKALPGEKIEIIATKLKKNYGYGKLVNIITPSSERVESACPVADKCGGCTLQHLSYPAQLRFKTNKVRQNLMRIGGFENIEIIPAIGMSSQPYRYRNKAQYPVSTIGGKFVSGFYANHSHRLVPNEDCLISPQQDREILAAVKSFMTAHQLTAYNEETHSGLVRHIIIKHGFHTDETMVCLVVNADSFKYKKELVVALTSINAIKSICISFNTTKTNVIMGQSAEIIYGKNSICDTIGGLKFNISPLSFFQVNPEQTEKLYKTALDFAELKGNETVIDAYCGTGTISLFLAQKAKKVYGVEIVPEAISAAKENAMQNGITNTEFLVGKSEDIVPKLCDKGIAPDVIVVDPPRKGCDETLLQLMKKVKPAKVVYVSCDSATLARDLKILSTDYGICKVQPVDMFPHTVHVETVVLMSRV